MAQSETKTENLLPNRANLGISIKRMTINDASQLPKDFATTPGGTFFSTTPGGKLIKIISALNQFINISIINTRNSNNIRSYVSAI